MRLADGQGMKPESSLLARGFARGGLPLWDLSLG